MGDPGRTVSENAPQPARQFGWSDMFVRPEDDPRSDTGFDGERATLVGFLRDQRLTLELKCAGLDASDLARRSVPPSNLSLLGLLRHMAAVEQTWFRIRMAGQDEPRLFRSDDDRDLDFNGAVPDPAVVAGRGTRGGPRWPSPSSTSTTRPTSNGSAATATTCGRCWYT